MTYNGTEDACKLGNWKFLVLANQQVTLKGLVGFHFLFSHLIFIYFLSMKPLSVELACLLGIQNEIQAVWFLISNLNQLPFKNMDQSIESHLKYCLCRKKFEFHDLVCWKHEKLDLLKPSGIKLFLDSIGWNYLTLSIRITDEIQNPKLTVYNYHDFTFAKALGPPFSLSFSDFRSSIESKTSEKSPEVSCLIFSSIVWWKTETKKKLLEIFI